MAIITDIQKLRVEVGDIDPDFPILSNDEYQYFLDKHNGNIRRAALDSAKTILFVLSRLVHEKADVLEVWGHTWAENYRQTLLMFIRDPNFSVGANLATPFAGGISRSDMLQNVTNPDNNTVNIERSSAAYLPTDGTFDSASNSDYFRFP